MPPACRLLLWALLLQAPSSAGCAATTLHTSPRALPAGKSSATFANQAGYVRVVSRQKEPPLVGKRLALSAVGATALPTYWQLRLGVGRGLEAGIRGGLNPGPLLDLGVKDLWADDNKDSKTRNSSAVASGFDFKIELHRGRVDLALDPAISLILQAPEFSRFELPLLWGLPLGGRSLLVVTTGAGYQRAPSPFLSGAVLRGGVGVRARISENWAFFPEIAALHQLTGTRFTALTAGLGFEVL